jgi:hypothetical protein
MSLINTLIYDKLDLSNPDVQYLQRSVSNSLGNALYNLYKNQPNDPHKHLAKYLLNHNAQNEAYQKLKDDQKNKAKLKDKHQQ